MDAGRIDDGKEAGALRTIGEVSRALGIKPHILRYWEKQFPALQPLTRSGGRRYYRPDDIAYVREIDRLLNRENFTMKGARRYLEAQGSDPVARADTASESSLRNIRNRLAAALES